MVDQTDVMPVKAYTLTRFGTVTFWNPMIIGGNGPLGPTMLGMGVLGTVLSQVLVPRHR